MPDTETAERPAQTPPLTDVIEWPNGEGETPCSAEYADLTRQIDEMSDFGRIRMDDMSPADYEAFNRLLYDRLGLQSRGHLGTGYRYAGAPCRA